MSFLPQQASRGTAFTPESRNGKPPVDRAGDVPLYEQVRNAVVDLISADGLGPGAILPSEHELCRELGVSRTVVRQALGQLENQGVVERVRGKGTFVARPKIGETLLQTLVGLYDDATQRGGTVRSDVIDHRELGADGDVADTLKLSPGDPVVRLERLRYVDGEPWSLSVAWMPLEVGQHTFTADMTTESLYQVLQSHGIVGTTGTRSVEALSATSEAARLLQVPKGSALMKLRSVRKDADGQVIEYFIAFHRGDRSTFQFELAAHETRVRIVSHEGPL